MYRKRIAERVPSHASVYQEVLGERFAELDPQLQVYFGTVPVGFEGIGTGCYETAGLRRGALRPMFRVLGWRGIAFAEHGVDVPFTVRNMRAADGSLRGTRTFAFPGRVRVMEDRMRAAGDRLIDRIGRNGEIEVALSLSVVDGRLRMDSRGVALRLGRVRLPLPPIVKIVLEERAVDSVTRRQRVDVRMSAPLFGEVYCYAGTFTYAVRRQRASASARSGGFGRA